MWTVCTSVSNELAFLSRPAENVHGGFWAKCCDESNTKQLTIIVKSNAKNISTFQKRRCLHFSEVDIIALSNFRSVGKYCHKQLQLVKITLYWDTSMHCIFCQTTNTNQNLKSGNARAENMEDQEKAIFRTLAIMVGAFTLAVLPTFIVVLTVLPTAK